VVNSPRKMFIANAEVGFKISRLSGTWNNYPHCYVLYVTAVRITSRDPTSMFLGFVAYLETGESLPSTVPLAPERKRAQLKSTFLCCDAFVADLK